VRPFGSERYSTRSKKSYRAKHVLSGVEEAPRGQRVDFFSYDFRRGISEGNSQRTNLDRTGFAVLVGLLVLLAVNAARGATSAPGAKQKPASSNFNEEWPKVAAAAKQEGKLMVNFGRNGARDGGPLFKAFEEKFGIKVTVGRGSGRDQINRMLAERAGSIYQMDVLATGLSSLLQRMVPSGALEPMENVLFHPDVVNKSLWRDGVHRYADKEQKLIFLMAGRTDPTELAVNTKLLKPDAIRSYRELLDPKWRGKIVTWHPVLHPIGEAGMASIFYSGQLGPEWFRRFYTEQNPFLVTEDRMFQNAVLSGSHPIGLFLGPMKAEIDRLDKEGFPITVVLGTPGEGLQAEAPRIGIGGSGAIAILNKPANPNAQKLFVNWLLGREGQWLVQGVSGEYQSFRADIGNENVFPPFRLPKGRLRVEDADPDSERLRKEMRKWMQNLFAQR
jgi:iron(III) transport system substrate-binding protein